MSEAPSPRFSGSRAMSSWLWSSGTGRVMLLCRAGGSEAAQMDADDTASRDLPAACPDQAPGKLGNSWRRCVECAGEQLSLDKYACHSP